MLLKIDLKTVNILQFSDKRLIEIYFEYAIHSQLCVVSF